MTAPASSSTSTSPAPPAIGIVRIRDVVRENQYFMHVPLDLSELVKRGLSPDKVRAVLDTLRMRVRPDPDATDEKDKTLTWIIGVRRYPEPPTAIEFGTTVVASDRF